MVNGVTGDALRIVYFGTPQFAVPTLRHLLESRHQVCGVVTQPDRPRGRGQKISDAPVKALAVARDIPVFQPPRLREADVTDTVVRWAPDLGVVAAYGKLLPEPLLAVPRFGMINVHASLLPKYRGAAPVHRAVIAGEIETGVTIMRVVKALDAGGMLAKVRRPIGADETSDVVEAALAEIGAELLVHVVDQIAGGTATEEPQDESLSTYAPRLTKEEGLIDWTLSASAIHNRVRGLYPWPHGYTYLDRTRLIVLTTSVEAVSTEAAGGTIVEVTRDALHVATGHAGRIAIARIQAEGKRAMSVREYLAGRPVHPGSTLTGP